MAVAVSVNGRITDGDHAVVSVFDNGFVFGEGVYEVLRTYGHQPFLYDEHIERLRHSAGMLGLPVPFTNDELLAQIRAVQAHAEGKEHYIRILLTRGVGEFSYDPASCPTPTVVIIVKPLAETPDSWYEAGTRVSLVSVTRNHPGSVNPRIKSNNLLNNALAMQEAIRKSSVEALMKNYRGELVECCQSNFFVVRDGAIHTAPLDAGLLAGITRAFVHTLAGELGIPSYERTLYEADLDTADETFTTNTTREIVPVVRIDDRVIGSGTPGPVTRRLIAAFRRHAAATSLHPAQA
ncbi:MAG: aminotransferase class IV [Acidobacteria bacterium]|nr:aminotransferase class IV [Acidobacteriota bacterium]